MYNAAKNLQIWISPDLFSFILGEYLGVWVLGHMVSLCLVFYGTGKLFFQVATPLYTHTSKA